MVIKRLFHPNIITIFVMLSLAFGSTARAEEGMFDYRDFNEDPDEMTLDVLSDAILAGRQKADLKAAAAEFIDKFAKQDTSELSDNEKLLFYTFFKFMGRTAFRDAFIQMSGKDQRKKTGLYLGIQGPEEHLAGILDGTRKVGKMETILAPNGDRVEVDSFKFYDPIRASKKGDVTYGEMTYTPAGRVFRSALNRMILNAVIMSPWMKIQTKLYDALEKLLEKSLTGKSSEDRGSLKYITQNFSIDPTLVALHPNKYFVGEKIEDYDSETYVMWAVMLVKKLANEFSDDAMDAGEDFVVRLGQSFLGIKDNDEAPFNERYKATYFGKVLLAEVFKETVTKPFIFGTTKKLIQNATAKKVDGLLPIYVVKINESWHKVYRAEDISRPQMARILHKRFRKVMTPEEVKTAGLTRGQRVIPQQTLTQRLLDNGYNLPGFTYSLISKVAGTYLFFAWIYPALPGNTRMNADGTPTLDVNGSLQGNSNTALKMTWDNLVLSTTGFVVKKTIDNLASYVEKPLKNAKETYQSIFKKLMSSHTVLTHDEKVVGVMQDGEDYYYVY